MDKAYVNSFKESTISVLSMMAGLTVNAEAEVMENGTKPVNADVSGVVGMSSPTIEASMALIFSAGAILKIVGAMFGEEVAEVNDEIIDAAGEITNMISGDARRRIAEQGLSLEAGIPSMVLGNNHRIYHKTEGSLVRIPFTIEDQRFDIELCMNTKNNA